MYLQKSSQSNKLKPGEQCPPAEDHSGGTVYNNQYVKKPGFAYYRDLAGKQTKFSFCFKIVVIKL